MHIPTALAAALLPLAVTAKDFAHQRRSGEAETRKPDSPNAITTLYPTTTGDSHSPAATGSSGGKYKKLKGPLDTPWTSEVTPENAWPQYPRPNLVRPVSEEVRKAIGHVHNFDASWLNLNGVWGFTGTNETETRSPKKGLSESKYGKEILVPYCQESALSGIMERNTYSWFRKEFTTKDLFPEGSKAKDVKETGRVFVNFGAVDWESTVFVNGHKIDFHRGGYARFAFDISDYIEWGLNKENVLEVFAYDPTDTDPLNEDFPIGKQTANPSHIFYTPCSGIWQTVWLELVPLHHILNATLSGDMDGKVTASVYTQTSPPAGAKTTEAPLTSKQPAKITFLKPGTSTPFHVANIDRNKETSFQMPKGSFELWSPEHPNLYNVTIEWEGDVVQSYLGFRTIESGKVNGVMRPLLNGEFVFQFGTLDQGFWPDGIYTAPTYEAMVYDLQMLKKVGMNMLRKHIKVEPDLFYEACDKMGLLLWQDQPSVIPSDSYTFVDNCTTITILPNEAQKLNILNEMSHMIKQLKGHPSIVTWVTLNEGWGENPTNATWPHYISQVAKELDPSRLVNAATGWYAFNAGDFSDNHHYSGPQCGAPFYSINAPPYNPALIGVQGEFGGVGHNLSIEHMWNVEQSILEINQTYEMDASLEIWNYRALRVIAELKEQTELFSCSAGVYTQTTDVEGEVNGLLSYDRRIFRPDVPRWVALIEALYAVADARKVAKQPDLFKEFNATVGAIPMMKRDDGFFGGRSEMDV